MLVADVYPNYSICGLPYYVAGDVPDWRSLAHRSRDELEATGMRLWLEHRATALDGHAAPALTLELTRLLRAIHAWP